MITLIQRVSEASVSVDDRQVASIGSGLVALIGVEKGDTDTEARRLAAKLLAYRVFADDAGRMNLSLGDTGGGLLLVPQFTLAANTHKGLRPSFASAAEPESGRAQFEALVEHCRQHPGEVCCGVFGASMQVALINDGPVTFWLQVPPKKGLSARV